jgi:hypothetical protein
VHPARPAVDSCPTCGRPRCGADAQQLPGACHACAAAPATPEVRPGRPVAADERLVRGALAAYAVAVLGGWVVSEYVGATLFSYAGPFLLGLFCGTAATRAAGTDRAAAARLPVARQVRRLAVAVGVLGVGLGFLLEGSSAPVSGSLDVLGPYALALAGGWFGTLPPKGQALGTDV